MPPSPPHSTTASASQATPQQLPAQTQAAPVILHASKTKKRQFVEYFEYYYGENNAIISQAARAKGKGHLQVLFEIEQNKIKMRKLNGVCDDELRVDLSLDEETEEEFLERTKDISASNLRKPDLRRYLRMKQVEFGEDADKPALLQLFYTHYGRRRKKGTQVQARPLDGDRNAEEYEDQMEKMFHTLVGVID